MRVNLCDLCESSFILSQADEWGFSDLWRASFIPELKVPTGKWPSGTDFFQHIEARGVKCFREARAEHEYGIQTGTEAIVALPTSGMPAYRCTFKQLPSIKSWWALVHSLFCDVVVSQTSCAWTLCLTHEEYAYFSYSKLSEGEKAVLQTHRL